MVQDTTSYYQTLRNITVAQLLLRYLQLEGATTLFGIPGAALAELLNELKNQRERFHYIICRQETGAAFIADGYARVTGKLGVVLVTSGPGATNALTGTMNAYNSHSAVLTITGEVPEKYYGRGYLQEGIDSALNVDAIYRNATAFSAVISAPSNFETLLRQALREALGNPRRATHISLPNNVAAAQFDTVHFPQRPENYRVMPRNSNPGQAAAALPRLTQARRPLLLLGNGCRQALLREGQLANLMAIVERFAIPVMTTPNGKGIFPESHPLSLRNYGLAACEWPKYYMHLSPQLQRLDRQPVYDALLVMGSALGDLATRMHTPWDPLLIPHGPFMQVDLNPNMIARSFPVALGIIGDIAIVLDNLRTAAERLAVDEQAVQERAALIEEIKTTYAPFTEPAKRRADVTPILPQALMAIVNELLPAGSHIFVDCANCVGWSLHYMVVDPPTEMHQALAMGPMGFGVGSVVGGKLGAPERTCVAIVGDGAFLMHGAEVSTAAQYYIGAIWIVLRDNNLTMVSQGQNVSYPDPGVWDDSYQIGQPDLVRYAEGLGAVACGVERPEQVRVALARAIQAANQDKPRPQVIVVQHNPHEIPPYYPLPYPPPSPAASI